MTEHEFEQRLAHLLNARGETAVEVVDPESVAEMAIVNAEKHRGLLGGLRRILYMYQRTTQFALGAAAVGLLLLFGFGVIGPGLFNPVGSTQSPTAQPASPSPTPTLDPEAACTPVDFMADSLPRGRYCVGDPFPVSMTFEIPAAGWWPWQGSDDVAGLINGASWGLSFFVVDNLYADPCNPDGGFVTPAPGSTVQDLVEALGTIDGYEVTGVADAAIGGRAGTELTLTATYDAAGCDLLSSTWGVTAAGWQVDGSVVPTPDRPARLWIGEVDGVRLVIARPLSALPSVDEWAAGIRNANRHADDLVELQEILDSLRFDP